jgi:hypothetical protein
MRRYSQEDEERIRAQRLVREWTRSRMLEPDQGARLEAELHVDVRRTNPFLRAALALFTAVIVAALVFLTMDVLGVRSVVATAAVAGIGAIACIGLADYLILTYRLYRFGVEEALAVAAVVLSAISVSNLTYLTWSLYPGGVHPDVVVSLFFAAGGLGLYLRYGFLYAAIGGIACMAAVPFQFDLRAGVQRVLAAAAIAVVLVIVRAKRRQYRDDYPGDEYGWLQAAAFAGLYAALNLQLPWGYPWRFGLWSGTKGLFYWSTYGATWILPIAGLVAAIRERDRELLDAGLALTLVTLLTNKPYLGWPRHTWDPIVLGFMLVAIAIFVRRWLASGPDGERHGFTSRRLLAKDQSVLSLARTASAMIAPPASAPPSRSDPADPAFGGGRSGGGGAAGKF